MATVVKPPTHWEKTGFTIFLAGVIDQGKSDDWQLAVTKGLSDYDVTLLNPRKDDWDATIEESVNDPEFVSQVSWESNGLEKSDYRVFCLLEDSKAPITLLEFGKNLDDPGCLMVENLFFRQGNLEYEALTHNMPITHSVDDLIEHLKEMLDKKGLKRPTKEPAADGVSSAKKSKESATSTGKIAAMPDVALTPAFKAWFNGSKVVDPTGQPLLMYHATQTDIDEFRPFTHFGTQRAANDHHDNLWEFYNEILHNPARARGSNIMPVYLSVVHPLRLPDLAGIGDDGTPIDNDADPDETDVDEDADREYPRGWEGEEAIATTLVEQGIIDIDEFETCRDNEDAMKLLEEKGYDGIVYENVIEDPGHDSWIVFSPSQIKSAIGNSGGFDPEKSSITASVEQYTYPLHASDGDVQQMIMDLHQGHDFEDWDRLDADTYQLKTIPLSLLEAEMNEQGDWSNPVAISREQAAAAGYKLDKDILNDEYDTVREYASQTAPFPPIVLNKKKHIVDGFHRAWAAKLRGDTTIRAYVPVREGKTASVTRKQARSIGPVYHGTTYDFDEFKRNKGLRSGFLGMTLETDVFAYFFSESKAQAISYAKNRQQHTKQPGRLITAYLSISNMLDLTNPNWVTLPIENPPLPLHKAEADADPESIYEEHAEEFDSSKGLLDYLVNYLLADTMSGEEWGNLSIDDGRSYTNERERDPVLEEGFRAYDLFDNKKVSDALRYLGFDGAKVPEGDDQEFGGESYCVFSANQVRITANVAIDRAKTASSRESNIDHWTRYAQNRTFKTQQEARDWVFDRLERADEQYAAVFGKNGPEKNREIANSLPFHYEDRKLKIGPKPKVPTERIGSETPEGKTPHVDWYAPDNQDSGRPTEESLAAYSSSGRLANVYKAYVSPSELPDPVLAEEQSEDGDGGAYDWSELEMSHRKGVPPPKIQVCPNGKVVIQDGNHRIKFWSEHGYDSIPVWVIDQRRTVKMAVAQAEETLYRGEGAASKKNGNFWTPDPEFAVQFTQQGRYEEIRKAKIQSSAIFTADPLPYGGDPDAMDEAVATARVRGFKAIRCSEGQGYPPSVWVFNRTALTPLAGKVTEPKYAATSGTETPAFKAWFRNSVVKDKAGNPLVVYRGEHGDSTSGEEFHSRYPSLSFGGADTASMYAMAPNEREDFAVNPRVYACYLRIEKPIVNDPTDPFIDFSCLDDALGREAAIRIAIKHEGYITETNNWDENFSGTYPTVEDLLKANPDDIRELYCNAFALLDDAEVVAALKAKGYDGAIHGPYGDGDHDEVEYKVFDHSQVKSATGNGGNFDPENKSTIASTKTADGPTQDQDYDDSMTQTPTFKSWFKGSQIVDDHGRPLRVYHGTAEDIDTFEHGKRRSTRGVDSGKPAFYFTPRADEAELWAVNSAARMGGDNVMPVFLAMKNPKVYRNWEDAASADVGSLLADGHDGFIRYYDEGSDIAELAVFSPNQIKSAIGNNGDFDPKSKSITAALPSKADGDILSQMVPRDQQPQYKVRPPKKLYRGVAQGVQESGVSGTGIAMLGKGLYTTRDKSFAKMYGKVEEVPVDVAWPRNPLVFNSAAGGAPSVLIDWLLNDSGERNIRTFHEKYGHDHAEYLRSKGYDGVIAGDEVVRFHDDPTGKLRYRGDVGGELPIVSAALKLTPAKSDLHAFMSDLWSQTTSNPFNDRERVWNDAAGIECSPFKKRTATAASRREMRDEAGETPKIDAQATANPAFKAWFSQSKVVNEDGSPRVVYHGSRSPWLTSFDLHCEGTGCVSNAKNGAIWFTSERDNATWFANYRDKFEADEDNPQTYGRPGEYYAAICTIAESEEETEHIFEVGPFSTEAAAEVEGVKEAKLYNASLHLGTFVTAAYLRMENPLVVSVVPRAEEFEAARKGGHDGIVAKHVVDGATWSDVFVVFSPNQIKSATRNTGQYSRETNSIVAAIVPTDRTLYHGTNTDDEFTMPQPNQHGIIWLAEEGSARDYSYTHYRKGRGRMYEVRLKLDANIVDLRDTTNPFVQACMKGLESHKRGYWAEGTKLTQDLWDTYADFGFLEGYPWAISLARESGVDGIIVSDTSEAYNRHKDPKHDSVAIVNPDAIESCHEVESDQLSKSITAALPSKADGADMTYHLKGQPKPPSTGISTSITAAKKVKLLRCNERPQGKQAGAGWATESTIQWIAEVLDSHPGFKCYGLRFLGELQKPLQPGQEPGNSWHPAEYTSTWNDKDEEGTQWGDIELNGSCCFDLRQGEPRDIALALRNARGEGFSPQAFPALCVIAGDGSNEGEGAEDGLLHGIPEAGAICIEGATTLAVLSFSEMTQGQAQAV